MKIEKLRASFGPLDNKTLELRGGLNIVAAENESGKSSWCAFIRAMLYGVDSSEREKAGAPKPDKVKFAPWSGLPMEGSMELEYMGRELTLTRRTKTQSAPMREFSALYTGTGEAVAGLDGKTAGEALVGAPRGVFERSAFIRQAGLAVSKSPELSDRIAAIVSTGDEDTSYADADERLRAWVRKRRYNKRGRLPELEAEISRRTEALNALRAESGEKTELEAAIAEAETQRQRLFSQVEESRKRQRKDALADLSRGKQELRALETSLEAAREDEQKKKADADRSIFAGLEPEEAEKRAMADIDEARRCDALSTRTLSPFIWLIPAVLALLCCLAGVFLSPWLFLPAAVFLAVAVVCFLRVNKFKATAMASALKRLSILERCGVQSEEELQAELERYARAHSLWLDAKEQSRKAAIALDNARAKQGDMDSRLLNKLDFSGGDSEAARLSRQLASVDERLRALREDSARTDGRLKTMGDPALLEARIAALREEYDRVSAELDSLELAVAVLGETNTEIQTRFSPRLGQLASEYMQKLTGGRYSQLTLDRDMKAEARIEGDSVARDAGFLSEGAENQLYLALRLAICSLALPRDEPCPIVLDDALVSFDDARMGMALELLRDIAQTRQVILFSCQKREAEYFTGDAGVFVTALE